MTKFVLLLKDDKIITLDSLDANEDAHLRKLLGDMVISKETVWCG